MADKLTDDILKKEILALSGQTIGPITDSTRPIYVKKLNHLRAKQNATRQRSRGHNLVGFSSEESDDDSGSLEREKSRPLTSRGKGKGSTTRASARRNKTPPPTPPRAAARRRSYNRVSTGIDKNATISGITHASSSGLGRPSLKRETKSATRRVSVANDHVHSTGSAVLRTGDILKHALFHEHESDEDSALIPDKDLPDSDAFDFSDSDVEQIYEPSSFAQSDYDNSMPEMVSHAVNTSPGLDSTIFSSYDSSCAVSPPPSTTNQRSTLPRISNIVSQATPNSASSSVNHSPQQDSAFPLRKVPIYRTRRPEHNAGGQSFSQNVSTFLLVLAGLFFVVLAFAYVQMASKGDINDTAAIGLVVCSKPDKILGDCVMEEESREIYRVVNILADELSIRAGAYDCGEGGAERRNMSLTAVVSYLNRTYEGWLDTSDKTTFNHSLELIAQNPQWGMRLLDKDGDVTDKLEEIAALESDDPTKSLWCRLCQALARVFNLLLVVVAVALLLTVVIAYMRYHRQACERETREVYDLVENIIDILKTHHEVCKKNKELQPYLAIPHVRDMLIPPADRQKRQSVWDKAVKFLSANESRVRVESQKISGEEFPVWRWLQTCPNGEKVWIGPAFGEYKDTGLNMPPSTPAPCLKIRNMFDLDIEIGEDWHIRVQDAILEKCGPEHGIVHIAVDKTSTEGCVYVKCRDLDSAGKAYKVLHGWWFDGSLVTVKFLRLERYHERFPDATHINTPMRPSNNQRLSLSRPYHRSIIETS